MGLTHGAARPESPGCAPERTRGQLSQDHHDHHYTRSSCLDSYLLEVDELGLVCVEVEAGAVVADGVSADGWWGVFELLGDVFDHCLAVHAEESTAHLKTRT